MKTLSDEGLQSPDEKDLTYTLETIERKKNMTHLKFGRVHLTRSLGRDERATAESILSMERESG